MSKLAIDKSLLTDAQIRQLIADASNITNLTVQSHNQNLSQPAQVGEQLSSSKGSGSDFAETRAYYSGDDIRHIDWRATARSSTPLVRTYHSELSQPLCLVIDRRFTMRFATKVRLKVTQALRMAIYIAAKEACLGREISAVLLDNSCHWLPAQQGMQAVNAIAKQANKPCPPIDKAWDKTNNFSWNHIFSGIEQHLTHGGKVVLLSDFIGLNHEDNTLLARLGHHYRVTAMRIVDPSEMTLSFHHSLLLQWADKMQFYSKNKDLQQQLNKKLKIREDSLIKLFSQANISYLPLSVEENELADFYFGLGQNVVKKAYQ